MAKTYNALVDDFITLSNDSSGSATGKTLINFGIRKFLGLSDWTFNKSTKTYSTGTSQQSYDPPYNMLKADWVSAWYGGRWYVPAEIKDGKTWQIINSVGNVTSSIPIYWFVSNTSHKISLYPASVDSKGTVKVGFTKKIRDYSASDYSTGSVTALSAGTVFSGIGTSWGSIMAGRYIKMSATDTAVDGFWFEILSVGSTGSLWVREPLPNAATNAAYTISEMMPFPDGHEDLPLWYALDRYYQMKEKPTLAREYERMWKEDSVDLLRRDSRSVTGLITQQGEVEQPDVNRDSWFIGTLS